VEEGIPMFEMRRAVTLGYEHLNGSTNELGVVEAEQAGGVAICHRDVALRVDNDHCVRRRIEKKRKRVAR
jgi:hypothetical protein